MANKRWDIFCRIVDNYGDIGVCWRLSQQLAREHAITIRLFIDDFQVASKLIAGLQLTERQQIIDGIEICPWSASTTAQPAKVVIETFSCELPSAYLGKMAASQSKWINVEYLSAEPWVNDFHAKPSPQPALNLTKYYFFPGFTEQTGGLIRERDLITQRNAFIADHHAQQNFWQHIGIKQTMELSISLFAYPEANIKDFLMALMQSHKSAHVFVPTGSILEALKPLYPKHDFSTGSILRAEALTLHVLPFLSQEEYEKILWACDINFVRGEDSWIRAIWAGKPFIWQPYIQSENTHLVKLEAFLDIYAQETTPALKACLKNAHYAWSATPQEASPTQCWQDFFAALPMLKQYAQTRSQALAEQADLASKLVIFSEKIE
jgi:uncharacterized repeat protein (TIGR03837 family)